MSTLKEIASAAGVSIMTVSNVVNGRYNKVSPETVKKINKLILDMNYVPNANARSLSTNRSQLIAMCISSEDDEIFLEDPYNSFIVGAVSKAAKANGYTVLLENESDLLLATNRLKSWNVAGAIFLGYTGESLDQIEQLINIPFVCLDCYPQSNNILTIGTNDFEAGRLAGNYLSNLGHREIAIASGNTILDKESKLLNPLLYYRFEGFLEGLKEHSIAFDHRHALQGEITYKSGIDLGLKLATLPKVTAVFCTADILAVGIIEGLRLSGKKVPQDMSVLGFDNLPISEYLQPKLSTINQRNTMKGQSAVNHLIQLINNPTEKIESIYYDVNVIERQSTLPI